MGLKGFQVFLLALSLRWTALATWVIYQFHLLLVYGLSHHPIPFHVFQE
jgi:hypothetical protein